MIWTQQAIATMLLRSLSGPAARVRHPANADDVKVTAAATPTVGLD